MSNLTYTSCGFKNNNNDNNNGNTDKKIRILTMVIHILVIANNSLVSTIHNNTDLTLQYIFTIHNT